MDNFSFVALDIETATGKRSSICEIGITIVKDSKIAESKSWLIQPKDNSYWRRNIEIHGINPEDTRNTLKHKVCELSKNMYFLQKFTRTTEG